MTATICPPPAAQHTEPVDVRALVARAQAGDAAAFGAIYERYVGKVYQFVYFKVSNRQLAEDLTSDVFLRAMRAIGHFTWQGRDFGAWLTTIARNLVIDHYKSGRTRLERPSGGSDVAERADTSASPSADPEAAAVVHLTNVALLRAVNRLKPEQRECVLMRFWLQMSVAETAAALKINQGAVKALQFRAVRALARAVPAEGVRPR
jgi:RNA polymerase sigma-70 factor, ECF subfamily